MTCSLAEEVEEDIGHSEDPDSEVEVVEKPRKISSAKGFFRGKLKCSKGFSYSVVLENMSTFYPSKTVDYDIKVIHRGLEEEIEAEDSKEDSKEEREAKIQVSK